MTDLRSVIREDGATDARAATPRSSVLRREVRRFLEEQRATGTFRPSCDCWMSAHSRAFSRELGSRGWIGMTWPTTYGGAGRSELDRLALVEELLAAGAPVAAHWFVDRQIGPALLRRGSEEQRRALLPRMARGEVSVSIGMSEPDSGSDLASIRTRADRVDGGWLVNGTKVWTSHAHEADYLLALVRTSPIDADGRGGRHAGLSQLLIDVTLPGIEIRPILSLDGDRHFSEVRLTDVRVDDDALLGSMGSGWTQVTEELAFERSGPERFLSTLPLLTELVRRVDIPATDPDLGRIVGELQTLRHLCRQVAGALQRGHAPVVDAALVKDLGTRFESSITALARRWSPVAPLADSDDDLARLLAQAVLHGPDATLRGGTNEILRGIVARSVLAG